MTIRQQINLYTPEKVAELAQCTVQSIYRHLNDTEPLLTNDGSPILDKNNEPVYVSKYFPNARVMGRRKWYIPEEDVLAYLPYDPSIEEINIVG